MHAGRLLHILSLLFPSPETLIPSLIYRQQHPIALKMSIQPLPPTVIAQIKSSATITSLNGVILELVKNAFDASCSKVDITVDYSRGGCVVEDNGLGIAPSEFIENGGLGKLYRE